MISAEIHHYRMGVRERTLIWFAGYAPHLLEKEAPEDREPIAKVGASVLFATVVAIMNWGIAGFTYFIGQSLLVRLVAAALMALAGGAVVVIFDRGFLFFVDTAGKGSRRKVLAYGFCRALIIVGVGSFTSQAIMPLILGSEMEVHALHMVEANENARLGDLSARHNLPGQEAALQTAADEVKVRQQAADTLPVDIQNRLASARSCWTGYSARKAELVLAGRSENEAREALSASAARCRQKSTAANSSRDAYLVQTRKDLELALADRQAKAETLVASQSAIATAVNHAREVEATNFTPRSSTVLWSLISSDPGAAAKWGLFSFLMLVFELLPLIQKFQAGQSLIGRRRATHRLQQEHEEKKQVEQSKHDFAVFKAVNAASREAIRTSMSNAAVLTTFSEIFAANIAAYAPTEAVRAMMRDLEARHVDVRGFMHRYPQYASIISQAWSNAVQQTSQLLGRAMRPGSAQSAKAGA